MTSFFRSFDLIIEFVASFLGGNFQILHMRLVDFRIHGGGFRFGGQGPCFRPQLAHAIDHRIVTFPNLGILFGAQS